ncbi:MAG: TldD/PmbA family protein [Armatimonadota bacterium]|nr:MAG: TldD/PmbA family protein [Armatimonadota bacterium]
MLGEAICLELLEAALAACECDQAEAILYSTNSSLTRFADSVIHQNVAEREVMISIRAVLGKRIGCARGNQPTKDEVQSVARRAADLARVSAEDEHFVSLPGPQPLPEVPTYSDATAASTPESRAKAVANIAAIAEKHGGRASGSFAADSAEIAVANSLGLRAYFPATDASLITVIADDDSSGYAEWRGTDLSRLDPEALAHTAARKCVDGRGAEAVPPGQYTVILEPLAVGDMLFMLGYMGFGATAFQEGRSFMCDRIGEKIAGDNITIWDDATDPCQRAVPCDWEGVPKRKTVLIESGVARSVVYDSYTAGKEGKQSTGHALPAPNTLGPLPTHLFLAAGDAAPEDMVANTNRGILVTRFHYTNIIHEKQTIFTGMTRDGTFLIEDGKVTKPVKNLRFTQSIVDALSNVEMIGRGAQLTEYAYVPALKIASFSFTS